MQETKLVSLSESRLSTSEKWGSRLFLAFVSVTPPSLGQSSPELRADGAGPR